MTGVRVYASFVAIVVGMFLLVEGSKLDPTRGILDVIFIVVGAMLVLSYFFLVGDYLEHRFRDRITNLMPVLLVLGGVTVYHGIVRPVEMVSKSLLTVLGTVLVLVSVFVIYKASKRS